MNHIPAGRATGKTFRRRLEALRLASEGKNVVFVCHEPRIDFKILVDLTVASRANFRSQSAMLRVEILDMLNNPAPVGSIRCDSPVLLQTTFDCARYMGLKQLAVVSDVEQEPEGVQYLREVARAKEGI